MNNKCPKCGIIIIDSGHVCPKEIPLTINKDKFSLKGYEIWDEEIKDTIQFASDLEELFQKYLTRDSCLTDVIIKCKKGIIKIERIK